MVPTEGMGWPGTCLLSQSCIFAAALYQSILSRRWDSFPQSLPPLAYLSSRHIVHTMASRQESSEQPTIKVPMRGDAFSQADLEDQCAKAREQVEASMQGDQNPIHPVFRAGNKTLLDLTSLIR